MPDFHAPFTREELEGRGWRFEEGAMASMPDAFLKTVASEDHGDFRVRIFEENWITVTSDTHYISIPMKSFPGALAAAEALLKGVG